MSVDTFQANLSCFLTRFPEFAADLSRLDPTKIGVAASKDGGYCYARLNAANKWEPLTDPVNPVAAAKRGVDQVNKRLMNGLSPAVIVGLCPGYALDCVFQEFAKQTRDNRPFRRIYVIVESLPRLIGWLKVTDRQNIIEQEAVSFHQAKETRQIATWCEQDLNRSHMFVPVSEMPENIVNGVIKPLADLYLRRDAESETFKRANDAYYDAITDTELARVINNEADRKPRVLIPAHGCSQVVRFSARDTATAFERAGWVSELLIIERDLSPWRLIKAIHDFKPDLFLMINHLRTENDEHLRLYPKNMLFVTWIQDTMPTVNRRDTAKKWNAMATMIDERFSRPRQRDLIVGYTEQLLHFNYDKTRLGDNMSMIVNTNLFCPRKLSATQRAKYACDVCFASNRSKPTEQIIDEELVPRLKRFDFTRKTLIEINDSLWREYRMGNSFTSSVELYAAIYPLSSFRARYEALSQDDQGNLLQLLYWRLNDPIYRFVVLEWLAELNVNFHLYGTEWDRHPTLSGFARGPIEHGEELSIAYQSARFCLHLNSGEGTHQRLFEIIASGGTPITRVKNKNALLHPDLAAAFRKVAPSMFASNAPEPDLTANERMAFNDFLFNQATTALNINPNLNQSALEAETARSLRLRLEERPDWTLENWRELNFQSQRDLREILKRQSTIFDF